MKRILVVSDSFKGTLSSQDICSLFLSYRNRNDLLINALPVADGGEGSLDTISKIVDGRFIDIEVHDLYFRKSYARAFISEDNKAAYLECASTVGMSLANQDNNPGLVTTYGIGEQIKYLINIGIKDIYVFLGGSASNDGGVGASIPLGTKFYKENGETFIPTGLTLKDISRIDNTETQELLENIRIYALNDVKSVFYGDNGAALTFAKQKGATDLEITLLDEGLQHLASIIKRDLNIDVSNIEGSGSAGGLGGGLYSFMKATMLSGVNTILDLMDFDNLIKNVDVVISGEGKLDKQTLEGKLIDGVAKRCQNAYKDLYLIVGISEISLEDLHQKYPVIKGIYETNKEHKPFIEIKDNAKKDYISTMEILLKDL